MFIVLMLFFSWHNYMVDGALKPVFTFTYHLTARITGAPQLSSQPVPSFFSVSTALWDSANSRPVHSLMLSSYLFFCLPCLLPLSLCLDERKTWPYHFSLRLFTMVRRSSCGPIVCWILARTSSLVACLCMSCVVTCGSTSFPWLVFFFGALLWGSMIHKQGTT